MLVEEYGIRYGPLSDALYRFHQNGRTVQEFLEQCRDLAIRILGREDTSISIIELDHTLLQGRARRDDTASMSVWHFLARHPSIPYVDISYRGIDLRINRGAEEEPELLTRRQNAAEAMLVFHRAHEDMFGGTMPPEIMEGDINNISIPDPLPSAEAAIHRP